MNASRFGFFVAVVLFAAGSVGCAVLPQGCGCGAGMGCAIEPGCGCDTDCGCEPGCAAEPDCGCEVGCGCGGRSMAFQKWCGGCDCQGPKINVCTGPDCGGCGCGEVSCAVEPGCAIEPGCGCEPSCGCGVPNCGCVRRLGSGLAFGLHCIHGELRRVFSPLVGCGGCGGCDGESYWSEWHNDPPRCCDPCNKCGDWVGPTAGYRAPYDHEFAPRRVATEEGLLPKLR